MTRSTRTAIFDRPACTRHDVIGCIQEPCRAERLNVSVAEYRRLVVTPARKVSDRIARRNAVIRNIISGTPAG